jgi:hypothetical protein
MRNRPVRVQQKLFGPNVKKNLEINNSLGRSGINKAGQKTNYKDNFPVTMEINGLRIVSMKDSKLNFRALTP